jgi:hypothetical protein
MQLRKIAVSTALMGSLIVSPMAFMGCESLPGDEKTQGAVIGGAGGALAGGMLAGDDDRLLGALIGGALGAGGGYLIGAQVEKANDDKDREGAIEAARRAERNPARAEDARNARTADLNRDGYVTLDELIAMEEAGLSDREMIQRLEDTNQFFELTGQQEQILLDRGVSREVILAMRDINQDERQRLLEERRQRSADPALNEPIGNERY